jgi:site-specific recombinase XerD
MMLQTEVASFISALAKVYRPSPISVAAYRGDLASFGRFLGDVKIEAITADRIRKYLTGMGQPGDPAATLGANQARRCTPR